MDTWGYKYALRHVMLIACPRQRRFTNSIILMFICLFVSCFCLKLSWSWESRFSHIISLCLLQEQQGPPYKQYVVASSAGKSDHWAVVHSVVNRYDEWIPITAESVMSVMGPVNVAGLQVRKILGGCVGGIDWWICLDTCGQSDTR